MQRKAATTGGGTMIKKKLWLPAEKKKLLFCLLAVCFLTGCTHERVNWAEEPIAEICEQELKNCFGEDYVLSDGVEMESRFFEEHEGVEIVTYYTQWELTWLDVAGREQIFTFTNRSGAGDAGERMDRTVDSYFSELVQEHYRQKFWNEIAENIPYFREEDSELSFGRYRLFSKADIPETKVMIKERMNYRLSEHICFPELAFEKVCDEFPYLFCLYIYVDYESSDEARRVAQRREIEKTLREMTDQMIQYTDGTLNACVRITMMEKEKGAKDSFGFAVLDGAYFPEGAGIEYEIALHENFFGPI